MSGYLLALALGPVQDFIAAGRRVADLQEGSNLLVTLAQAAAHQLEQSGARLIFPSRSDDPGAPNKLLVRLSAGSAPPEEFADAAEEAVRNALHRERKNAWKALSDEQRHLIDKERFEAQIDGFLEFYAAYLPLDSDADYPKVRKELDRLLAARKALRDFPAAAGTEGVPKSPLNPAYETALKAEARPGGAIASGPLAKGPLFLKGGELLDGISLMKRVNGHKEAADRGRESRVPSTAEMAMRFVYPILRDRASEELTRLKGIANLLYPEYELGDLFFPNRVDDELPEKLSDLSVFEEVKRLRRTLLKAAGRAVAPPYYALLLADGDNMGKLLDSRDTPKDHIAFSSALCEFSKSARDIITKSDGFPIYLGGDDAMALVPLHRAIECAASLRNAFGEALGGIGLSGTLSAGIVVVHYLEPLQRALEKVRAAEKAAKKVPGKDALALALHPRGGEPVTHAAKWDGGQNVAEWDRWTMAFRGELARGLPYEIEALAHQLEGPEGFDAIAISAEVLRAEFERIVRRKDGGEAFLQDNPDASAALTSLGELKALGERLRIARFLASPEGER